MVGERFSAGGAVEFEWRARIEASDKVRSVDARRVHLGADRKEFHLGGVVGSEEGGELFGGSFWVEPAVDMFGREDEGHAGVDRGEECVGFDGDDRKGFEFAPAIPKSAEDEGIAGFEMDVNGLFAAGDFQPFEKTVGEDEAAFFAKGSAKGGFGGDAFGAGIDEAASDFFVLRPKRDEAPARAPKLGTPVLVAGDDGGGLRGGEIIARDEIDLRLFQAYANEELFVALGIGVTSAHGGQSFHSAQGLLRRYRFGGVSVSQRARSSSLMRVVEVEEHPESRIVPMKRISRAFIHSGS